MHELELQIERLAGGYRQVRGDRGALRETLSALLAEGIFDHRDLLTPLFVLRYLARIDGSLAQIPQSHFVFAQRVAVNNGELVANAQAPGNRPMEIATVGGRELLSGTKRFCTGSAYANGLAVTLDDAAAVLIAPTAPGVTVVDDWVSMGQSETSSGSVIFEDVDITDLPRHSRDDALALPHYGAFAQALHAAIDLGLAEGAFAAGLERAGLPEGELDEGRARVVGEMDVALFGAQAAFDAVVRAFANDPQGSREQHVAATVTRAKVLIGDAALEIASDIFRVTGTAGVTGDDPLDRYWRDLRTHTLHDRRADKILILGRRTGVGADIALTEKLS